MLALLNPLHVAGASIEGSTSGPARRPSGAPKVGGSTRTNREQLDDLFAYLGEVLEVLRKDAA